MAKAWRKEIGEHTGIRSFLRRGIMDPFNALRLVIANPMVSHELASSEYGNRRAWSGPVRRWRAAGRPHLGD